MSKESDKIGALQNLARAVVQVSHVSVPELTITDEMAITEPNGRDWYEVEQDKEWWASWNTIWEIVQECTGSAQVGDLRIRPDVPSHRRYNEVQAKGEYTSLSVKVYASGELDVLAEYAGAGPRGSWTVLHEGRISDESLDPIEIGRTVASAELALVASKTKSCSTTLDYWQTELAPQSFRQRDWGKVRGVGRQAVNNSVQSASTAMIRDHGPAELYEALNSVATGDVLDFAFVSGETDNVTGGRAFRVEEVVEKFGDGDGHIRCENDVDDVVTDIREYTTDGRVAVETDGEIDHIAAYVTIQ